MGISIDRGTSLLYNVRKSNVEMMQKRLKNKEISVQVLLGAYTEKSLPKGD